MAKKTIGKNVIALTVAASMVTGSLPPTAIADDAVVVEDAPIETPQAPPSADEGDSSDGDAGANGSPALPQDGGQNDEGKGEGDAADAVKPSEGDAAAEAQPETAPIDSAEAEKAAQAAGFKTVEEYNALLKEYAAAHPDENLEALVKDDSFMHIVLSRYLVQEAGYDNLASKANENPDFKAMLEWLLADYEMLSYYVFTGAPEANASGGKVSYRQPGPDTWISSLEVLSNLYKEHAADITKAAQNASLNKRMMAAIALTHGVRIATWIQLDWNAARTYQKNCDSEAVERYEIFKRFYENGLLYRGFDALTVPELRMVMWAPIGNDELQWANYYYHVKVWGNTDYETNPRNFGISDARHMGGMFPYGVFDYSPYSVGALYWDQKNYDKFNDKYDFAHTDAKRIYDFDIGYGFTPGEPFTLPLWIVLDTVGVCYHISATSTVGLAALGIPSSYTEQPAHVSFLTYNKDAQNRITWGQGYDVYGMKRSGKKGVGSTALPLGWSDMPWSSYYSMSYVFPAGEALTSQFNTDFRAAQGMNFLGEAALDSGDAAQAETLFRAAIDAQYMNIGAWDGLKRAYELAGNKTEQDWIGLAKEASGKIRQFASVYNDYILNAIAPNVAEGSLAHYELVALLAGDLYWGKDAKNEDIQMVQPAYCREFASWWYSNLEFPATFSFNAGGFSLSKTFAESSLEFEYSVDGGTTWKPFGHTPGGSSYAMPEEDKKAINAEQDILYRAQGAQTSIRIDMTAQSAPVSNAKTNTVNDDEDVFVNIQQGIEFSTDQGAVWHPLTADSSFEGDQEVWIRWGYSGTKIASPHTVVNFTQGEGTPERSYIKSKGGKIVVESAPLKMGGVFER